MKKFIAILLTLVITIGLCACSTQDSQKEAQEAQERAKEYQDRAEAYQNIAEDFEDLGDLIDRASGK